MESLRDKKIYIIGTGARKIVQLPRAIREFTDAGAKVYTIMSRDGREICDSNLNEFEIPGNTMVKGYSMEGEMLPLEDLVLLAPCTFNTLNKVAIGIADTYPTTIVASSIGQKRKVIIAPAMNYSLWSHPQTQESMRRVQAWGCEVVYPEVTQDKVTMAPIEKVADSVFHSLAGVRYESQKQDLDKAYAKVVEENFPEFRRIGESMVDLDLTRSSAGCLSKKVPGGYLVSSSGSHIGSLSQEELTLIKGREGDKVIWQGYYPPSSETPLLLEVYEAFPDADSIIHGHCPRVTYDLKMQKYVTEDYVRYGLFGKSDKIVKVLRDNGGFGILKLHGEISTGKSMSDSFDKLKSKLEEAHE